MKKRIIVAVTVLSIFILSRYLKYVFRYIFGLETWLEMDFNLAVSYLNYTKIFIALVATAILFKKMPFEILGLKKDILKGLLYGFLFTLPMFIGYGYKAGFKTDITLSGIHMDMILAGFFEEFFYRGFVFGILFYYCGWGFITAVIIPSIFFGIGHLYQAETMSDAISVFLFTALGGAGFAWFYVAWRSLWMVAFLHGFMDLAWDMFNVQDNVVGSLWVNIFRFTTLGIAIYFSVRKAKKEGTYSLKDQLWVNRKALEPTFA